MRKKFLLLFLFSALFIVVFYFSEQDAPVKVKIATEGSMLKDVQFMQKKDGMIKLNVHAKNAFLQEDQRTLKLEQLMIFIPERDFKVTANLGYYDIESGNLTLLENVEGLGRNFKLKTSEASWDSKEKSLFSDKPIIVEGKKFTIEANAGIANENLIELKKGVRAFVYLKK